MNTKMLTPTVFKSNMDRKSCISAFVVILLLSFFTYLGVLEGRYFSSGGILLLIAIIRCFAVFYPKNYRIGGEELLCTGLFEKRSIKVAAINRIERQSPRRLYYVLSLGYLKNGLKVYLGNITMLFL